METQLYPVPEAVKEERWHRFMQQQAAISRRRLAARVGRREQVLVDHVDGDVAIARSAGDAPEIDGVVHIRDGAQSKPGSFEDVVIESSDDYDVSARLAR